VTQGEALAKQRQAKLTAAQATLAREETIAAEKLSAQAQIQQAETRVAQTVRSLTGEQQHVAQAEAKVKVAAGALAREQKLFAANLRAQQELQTTENEVAAARIARDSAAETLKLLGLSPSSRAQGRGGRTVVPIRTPRGGLVIARDMNNGEVVEAKDTLATVLDLRTVYVEISVYEKDLPRVALGQLVRLRVSAYPDEEFRGRVSYISGELDKETRTSPVRARIDNPAGKLRPEMFATVTLEVGAGPAMITVPEAAVQTAGEETFVFVQTQPYTYEKRPVILGPKSGDQVELQAGLKEGEVIVQNGSFLLKSQTMKGQLEED
jgi:cobalt-zinc-cadmium efflux system membrane fusion protein